MRTNAPRMITVIIAVALLVVGLALVYVPGQVNVVIRAIADLGLPSGIENDLLRIAGERAVAWGLLAASPLLLILGSLLKGL